MQCLEDLLTKYHELSNNSDFVHYVFYPIVIMILYGLYYKKFSYYINRHTFDEKDPRLSRKRGQAPPSFPNGWFKVLSSWELKKGDSEYVKANGRHVVVFRGEDNQAYCLSTYCGHMGANLGFGGQVKWKSCIECPFHGWTYNGKDGKCVNSEKLDTKKVEHLCYEENYAQNDGKYLQINQDKKNSCESSIDKYEVQEQDGIIYVWFHSQNKPPQYKLGSTRDFQFCQGLVGSAESWDYVNAHLQEIPENGGDFKHLQVVHVAVHQILYPYLQYKWVPKSAKLNQKDFDDIMGHHPLKDIRKAQNTLFHDIKKVHFGQEQHVNCLAIDSYLQIFGIYDMKLGTATVFQVGSGTVYLFMNLKVLGRLLLIQTVTPIMKFTQQVCHKMYTHWWLPSWMSAAFLSSFIGVVNQDLKIWNNKIFSRYASYGKNNTHDQQLKDWRENFAKYYEGCLEWEQKEESLIW